MLFSRSGMRLEALRNGQRGRLGTLDQHQQRIIVVILIREYRLIATPVYRKRKGKNKKERVRLRYTSNSLSQEKYPCLFPLETDGVSPRLPSGVSRSRRQTQPQTNGKHDQTRAGPCIS
jgi:hypothetical protein